MAAQIWPASGAARVAGGMAEGPDGAGPKEEEGELKVVVQF